MKIAFGGRKKERGKNRGGLTECDSPSSVEICMLRYRQSVATALEKSFVIVWRILPLDTLDNSSHAMYSAVGVVGVGREMEEGANRGRGRERRATYWRPENSPC